MLGNVACLATFISFDAFTLLSLVFIFHVGFLRKSKGKKHSLLFMEKESFIPMVVKWAQAHGFKEIQANMEGFETPKSYERAADNEKFTPDVTGVNMFNRHYLEVSIKTDQLRGSISKWKLLSELAGMKGAKLYLMAPRGHVRFTREVITQYNIPAEVIKME